jgi:tetratricopeptide (TPR) repeat protein
MVQKSTSNNQAEWIVTAGLWAAFSLLGNIFFVDAAQATEGKTLHAAGEKQSDSYAPTLIEYLAGLAKPPIASTGICATHLLMPPHRIQQDVNSLKKLEETHIKKLEEQLRLDPANHVVRNELAKKLAILGRYDAAAGHFESLLAAPLSHRNRWAVLNNYGNLAFLGDSLSQAESFYHLALHADSSGKKTYLNLGTLHTALDDSATAIAMYRQVVRDSVELQEVEQLLGLSDGESEAGKGNNHGPKNGKQKSLKKKVKANLQKAAKQRRMRPLGVKREMVKPGAEGYNDVGEILYWAEVK